MDNRTKGTDSMDPTATTDALGAVLEAPHARARGGRPLKHGGGRQRKLSCSCGFICYVTAGALERYGYPSCACGGALELANFRDRLAVDEAAALAELGAMPAPLARELLRAEKLDARSFERYLAGAAEREAARTARGGARQKRCTWAAGYCSRFTAGRYCGEHTPGSRAER